MKLLLLLGTILLFVGCSGDPDPVSTPSPSNSPLTSTSPSERPDLTSPSPSPSVSATAVNDKVHLQKTQIKTKQGQKSELDAESVQWADSRQEAKAKGVTWYLLDDDTEERLVKVESPVADIDLKTNIIVFSGETIATRIGFPESLKVKKLVYKGKDKKFYGSGGVLWKRATASLSGDTLTATADLDRVQVKGRVKGKIQGGFDAFKSPE